MKRVRVIVAVTLAATASAAAAGVACGDDDADASRPTERARHGLTAEQASEVLAKIGDRTITVGELADRLAEQSPYLRARYNSPERRREFLDNVIRFEVLAAEARRRGYADLPEIQRSRKQMMIQEMIKRDIEERLPLSSITDEEIRAYYEGHRDEFNKPAQVRASHILMKNRGAAQRVLAQLLARPADIELFRALAAEHNEDAETRETHGDLRFFSRPGESGEPSAVPDPVREAAFGITEIGGYHPELVQSPAGFHVVKLVGRRAALRRTLEEARRTIQNKLWREKRQAAEEELVARLRQAANVEEHFERLGDVRIDIPANVPDEPAGEDPSLAPTGAEAAPGVEQTHGQEGPAPSAAQVGGTPPVPTPPESVTAMDRP